MNGRTLLDRASAFAGIPASVLLGRGRTARLSMVRMVVMYVLYRELGYSSLEIGRLLRRDSSNVRHLIPRVEFRIENDPAYKRLHAHLMNELNMEAVAV